MTIYKWWRFFLSCGKGLLIENIRKSIIKVDTADCLTVNHYGTLNSEKLLYYIEVNAAYSGWSSVMNKVVSALVVAKRYGLIPVIKLGYSALYSEENAPNLSNNLFEYYYRQPTQITIEEMLESKNVIGTTGGHFAFAYNMKRFEQNSPEMDELAEAVKTFLHLNEETERYIKQEIEKIFSGKKAIGVHVRGTDYKAGFKGHPVYVMPEEYMRHVKAIWKDGRYDQIFLATDEEDTVQLFQREFGDKVVFHEVYRARGDTKIGIHCTEEGRPLHHYKLGLEVLLDIYSLAYCNALVASQSGVAFHALVNKRASGEEYEVLDIIDKGRYKNGKISISEVKKIRKRH